MLYKNEVGAIELTKHVIESGVDIPSRTGIPCRAIFDAKIVYDTDTHFPFSTIRVAGARLAFEEFWFFLRGKTQTKELEAKGVNFWKGNSTREFLDSRGLQDLPEGDIGKAYGAQLRNFGQSTSTTVVDYGIVKSNSVDQLQVAYDTLKKDPYSRRVYSTLWNPNELHLMALTPCHHSHQFVVLPDGDGNNVLHLKLLNRSLDIVFGLSYAVQNYALYQLAMAKLLGMKVGKLSVDLTHVHIYENQIEYAKELVEREFGCNGTLAITKELNTLEDLLALEWSDFSTEGLVVNTQPFVTPRPPMAV